MYIFVEGTTNVMVDPKHATGTMIRHGVWLVLAGGLASSGCYSGPIAGLGAADTTGIWLDDEAMQNTTHHQAETHKAFMRSRWLPAWIDTVEYGKFGRATAMWKGGSRVR